MRMILISHSEFAKGILSAATMIVGENDFVSAIGLMPEDDLDSMGAKIENEITSHNAQDEEVLLLSDLYFGSPFVSAVPLMERYKIQHIAGMNLGMVIQAICMIQGESAMEDIVKECLTAAHDGIKDVNATLQENQ